MKQLILILSLLFFIGCAHTPTYTEQLSARPVPTHNEAKIKECTWIRSEIARMNNISAFGSTNQYALLIQADARKNIASLEAHAAKIGCNAAFSNVVIQRESSINNCIEACKKNTSRTPEECFDNCNK